MNLGTLELSKDLCSSSISSGIFILVLENVLMEYIDQLYLSNLEYLLYFNDKNNTILIFFWFRVIEIYTLLVYLFHIFCICFFF